MAHNTFPIVSWNYVWCFYENSYLSYRGLVASEKGELNHERYNNGDSDLRTSSKNVWKRGMSRFLQMRKLLRQ